MRRGLTLRLVNGYPAASRYARTQTLECPALWIAIETVNRDHVHLTFWAGGTLCRCALLL